MSASARISAEAVSAAAKLPPLLAEAYRVAASVGGIHGRRASGAGETFWQYRHAQPGDALGAMDWRRSGRSDDLFVRETEWESAQTVFLWPDTSASMDFASEGIATTKADRARLITLAVAVLLERADERFALVGADGQSRHARSCGRGAHGHEPDDATGNGRGGRRLAGGGVHAGCARTLVQRLFR